MTHRSYSRSQLSQRFALFAQECRASSPLYERLSLGIANDDQVLDLAAGARKGQPVPNLLFAAVHLLLLAGDSHPLADFYPSVTESPNRIDDPYPYFHAFCIAHRERISALLVTHLVQTNEVRRSACLVPAFGIVAREAGDQALALIEIGSSAGLNLRWDRYRYAYGDGQSTGNSAASVVLTCDVRGELHPPIPLALPNVVWRAGVDLNPINVNDPEATAWLQALVWPEQRERATLLEQALAAARLDPPPLRAGNALDLLPELVAAAPDDAALCIFDTYTINQFTAEDRQQLAALLDEIAARRRLFQVTISWVGGESPTLRLASWVTGERAERTLARCDAHGAWIEWLGSET